MHPKLARLNEYLQRGFEFHGVDSDHGRIDVSLVKDEMTLTLTLTREDAAEILWGGRSRHSHLVTLPLR